MVSNNRNSYTARDRSKSYTIHRRRDMFHCSFRSTANRGIPYISRRLTWTAEDTTCSVAGSNRYIRGNSGGNDDSHPRFGRTLVMEIDNNIMQAWSYIEIKALYYEMISLINMELVVLKKNYILQIKEQKSLILLSSS